MLDKLAPPVLRRDTVLPPLLVLSPEPGYMLLPAVGPKVSKLKDPFAAHSVIHHNRVLLTLRNTEQRHIENGRRQCGLTVCRSFPPEPSECSIAALCWASAGVLSNASAGVSAVATFAACAELPLHDSAAKAAHRRASAHLRDSGPHIVRPHLRRVFRTGYIYLTDTASSCNYCPLCYTPA